jgi:hypothetical protein
MAHNNDTEQLTRAITELTRATLEGAETREKIRAVLEEILPVLKDKTPCATMPTSPGASEKKRGGRPAADVELMLYAAFVDLAEQLGYNTDEALNSLIRQVVKKRGLPPTSRETLKKRLKALRQRVPRPL